MDFHGESADPFDEILRSIKASSHNSSQEEEPLGHDFHRKANQGTDEHKASPIELFSSISDTFPPSVFREGDSEVFSPNFISPFQTMIAPSLTIESPTAQGNAFRFLDISNTSRGISRTQTSFGSPLKTSLDFQNDGRMFDSSPPAMFSSSPDSPGAFTAFPVSSHNLYGDHVPFINSEEFGVPIARSNIKAQPGGITGARKAIRHHRNISGTSSTTSTISSPLYDVSWAIDPSALQPPLSNVQIQLEAGFANIETSHIISPFMNQVVEQRPDGTLTGRYSRPLTSTGRPSHARKTPPGHVKRPRNAFILFRSYACSSNLIPPAVEKDHRQISRIVSHMWKALPSDERLKWERQAEEEKDLHRKLHPDYRYKPVYRKENCPKKSPGRLGSSSAARKKGNGRKNAKGLESDAVDCDDLSRDSEDVTAIHQQKSADLQRERDDEIRCEAVAKVLMETKLSGITLDEGELEERVLEQVRLVKINDTQQFQVQPNSDNGNHSPESASCLNAEKPTNKILAPLLGRRKSSLNRSNSAPPPPSPLRMMHAREVVYNPKARGSRELSPDFPKPKLLDQEDMMMGVFPCDQLGDLTHQEFYPVNFDPQPQIGNEFHPLVDPSIGNPPYHHHQFNLTSTEDFAEHLFPDFTFAGESAMRPRRDNVSRDFFNSHMIQGDIHDFNNGDYSSNLDSP